jgi:hypothetical protein
MYTKILSEVKRERGSCGISRLYDILREQYAAMPYF